ncbi:hypothetical protein [Pedobacter nutrimenti]|uniref:hypothetical protein n=1 Tax=Pedobacter nutrimenti TaxID=1241337 RepID=UPI0029308A2C|nr:hypothetical protein [Pedobacter nutrimenti]
MKKLILVFFLTLGVGMMAQAQILGKLKAKAKTATEISVDRSTDKVVDQAINKTADNVTDKTINKVGEKIPCHLRFLIQAKQLSNLEIKSIHR